VKEKLVLVTGASRGLGKDIARHLIDAGYITVGISRTPANFEAHNYYEYLLDLSDLSSIPELVRRVVANHGTPYGLINNSAIGLDGLLATQHNDEIALGIALNLTSPILLTKYVSRQMLSAGQGRIINISSIIAQTGYAGLSVYGATKSGLNGFTKSLSRELGRRNITVNAIQPGFLETQMTIGLGADNLEKIARRAALRRVADTGDVAGLVLFLLAESGKNISGSIFTVDAGSTA
jgi:3-oxoacyl-[acyl-carrier protein] reductase